MIGGSELRIAEIADRLTRMIRFLCVFEFSCCIKIFQYYGYDRDKDRDRDNESAFSSGPCQFGVRPLQEPSSLLYRRVIVLVQFYKVHQTCTVAKAPRVSNPSADCLQRHMNAGLMYLVRTCTKDKSTEQSRLMA